MKKKILICSILFLALLGINQVIYLTKVQYICTNKIAKGDELNLYETLSALQTHSMLWLLGWIVEPNTAQIVCKTIPPKKSTLVIFHSTR